MDRQTIVKLFLDKGYQLEPKLLDHLMDNQKLVKILLDKIDLYKGKMVLTLNDFQSLKVDKLNVLKTYKKQNGKISTNDVLTLLKNRYDKLSQILQRRLELVRVVSINRINQNLKNFSIIGMVREKDKEKMCLNVEDNTGEIKIFFEESLKKDFNSIFLDDVLGFSCEMIGNKIIVRKVVYPDIPLKTKISKTENDLLCLFISNVYLDSDDLKEDYFKKFIKWVEDWKSKNLLIFVVGGVYSNKEKVEDFLKQIPCRDVYLLKAKGDVETDKFTIEDPVLISVDGVIMFLTHGDMFKKYVEETKTSKEETCLQLLKKRHFNPTVEVKEIDLNDEFFIDQIPDIIVCGHSENPTYLNYKGTTIISCGDFYSKPLFWAVNLKTREIFKVDFT